MEPSTSSNTQQPCTSQNLNNQPSSTQDDSDNSDPAPPGLRRNAITPEAHHVDPIRQTEIQEKMSSLTMGTSGGDTAGEGTSNQSQ